MTAPNPATVCEDCADLVVRMARQFFVRVRRLLDFDTVTQCVRIGVWVAATKYDPARGPFEGLAWRCCSEWIALETRFVLSRGLMHGPNKAVPGDLPSVGPIPLGASDPAAPDEPGWLGPALATLTDVEAAVAARLATYHESEREAARNLCLLPGTCHKIVARLRAKLPPAH